MDDSPQLQNLLNQSSALIRTQSDSVDNQELIEKVLKMNDKTEYLNNLRLEIPKLAQKGETSQIGICLTILEHFGASPDIRKILHFFAQSESERGKQIIEVATKDELLGILDNIARAFKLANLMDSIT